MILQDLFFF